MIRKSLVVLLFFLVFSCSPTIVDQTRTQSTQGSELLSTITGTGKHAILIFNTNSGTDFGVAQVTGQTNFNLREILNNSISQSKNFSFSRPIIKDLVGLPSFNAHSLSFSSLVRPMSTGSIVTNRTFYAYYGNDTVQISANLVYGSSNTVCLIYAEAGNESGYDAWSDLTWNAATWTNIGQTFDRQIYPVVTETFGSPTDVDQNGHIIIFYYRMFESANSSVSNESTLGFFYPADLYTYNTAQPDVYPNEAEIFYLNLNWAAPQHPEMQRTLAHEFQHMINFGQRVVMHNLRQMDLWINEGMSEFSESVALGSFGNSRIQTFKNDSNNKIKNGYPLTVWNSADEDYALSYTFMNYVFIQSGYKLCFFKDFMQQTNGNPADLARVLSRYRSSFSNFTDVFTHYWLANLLNVSSGINGYTGDPLSVGKTNFWTNSGTVFDFSGELSNPSENVSNLLPSGVLIYLTSDSQSVRNFHLNLRVKDPGITVIKVED